MFGRSKLLIVLVLALFAGLLASPIILHTDCAMPTCEVDMDDCEMDGNDMTCCMSNQDCDPVFTPVTTAPVTKVDLQVKLVAEFVTSISDNLSFDPEFFQEFSRNKNPHSEAYSGFNAPLLI
jgi:hypothetical protein